MRVKVQGFLFGKSHSWAYVNQNLGRSLLKLGHDVEFVSTDGNDPKHTPNDLKPFIKSFGIGNYDMQISYTAMINFPQYLSSGDKNRFGIWCYEFPIIPKDFIKYYKSCDKILAPSNFAKDIFINNKVPGDSVVVVPHGIDLDAFNNKNKFKLKTNKKIKFLIPLGQPHIRKAIPETIESFYKAFTNKDDVCLVAKIPSSSKEESKPFEVDVKKIINKLNEKYRQHPEIELITDYVPDMVSLFNACDVVYSLTHAECFFMPALEGFAANKLVVVPGHGGQLDFCNNENSLLISGKEVRAPMEAQYWSPSPFNSYFEANQEHAVEALRSVYRSYDSILESKKESMKNTVQNYTWDNAINLILKEVV
jgi:glycosyltransferase involved in cell wall biosynthesis